MNSSLTLTKIPTDLFLTESAQTRASVCLAFPDIRTEGLFVPWREWLLLTVQMIKILFIKYCICVFFWARLHQDFRMHPHSPQHPQTEQKEGSESFLHILSKVGCIFGPFLEAVWLHIITKCAPHITRCNTNNIWGESISVCVVSILCQIWLNNLFGLETSSSSSR